MFKLRPECDILENVYLITRIWEDVKTTPSGCWEWLGWRHRYGLKINGKIMLIHRIIYELCIDSIPDGMFVLHHCDNPPCCNPKHLWIGDNSDNSIQKGRAYRGDHKGTNHGGTNFSDDQIRNRAESKDLRN